MKNIGTLVGVMAAAMLAASCGKDGGGPDGFKPPVGVEALAEQCGIDVSCKAGGLAEGNAAISGVASVDAFFKSVLNFEAKANAVSSGIEAELQAIRGDFGIAADADLKAGLEASISANVEGSFTVDYEPAKCQVDVQATLEAQAECDASIDPGSAMVECKGSCEAEAGVMVDCGASATLECTATAPSIECSGECTGTCEADFTAAAACSGTCKGSCDGTCSAMDGEGNCAGKCDGMCQGTCDIEVTADAMCSGTCKGSCKAEAPSGMCEAGAQAECTASGDAMVMCSGSCDGAIEPPMAKAECQASAKAEASLNVECTPPRVAAHFELKAGLDAMAQAKFEAAVKNLVELRLPRILAAVKKAELVVDAGAGLTASASGAVKGAIDKIDGGANLKVVFGLKCALGQLGAVGSTISGASGRLKGNIEAVADITGAVGA